MLCTASGALAAISSAMPMAVGEQVVVGGHLLDDADALGGAGVDPATGEGEQLGPARPDLVGQAQVATGVDAHPDLGLGQGEHGVLGGDADVGHEHQLEAEPEAVALHGRHDGLGELGEDLEPLVGPADALVVIARLLGRRPAGHPVLGHARGRSRRRRRGPRPAATTTRTRSSKRIWSARAPSWRVDSQLQALSLSGRLRVRTATWSLDLEVEVPLVLGDDGGRPEHGAPIGGARGGRSVRARGQHAGGSGRGRRVLTAPSEYPMGALLSPVDDDRAS